MSFKLKLTCICLSFLYTSAYGHTGPNGENIDPIVDCRKVLTLPFPRYWSLSQRSTATNLSAAAMTGYGVTPTVILIHLLFLPFPPEPENPNRDCVFFAVYPPPKLIQKALNWPTTTSLKKFEHFQTRALPSD